MSKISSSASTWNATTPTPAKTTCAPSAAAKSAAAGSPFNGSWRKEYEDEDGFRQGYGVAEVEFKRNGHVIASVSVIVPGGGGSFETCHGFFANRVKRGPLLLPSV